MIMGRGGWSGKTAPRPVAMDWWIIFILEAHRMNDVEDSVAFCVLFPVFVAVRSTQCREAEDTTFVRPKDECGLDRKGS
jgi:hypothetical protein